MNLLQLTEIFKLRVFGKNIGEALASHPVVRSLQILQRKLLVKVKM